MTYQESKFRILRDATEGKIFTVEEAARALDVKKSSASWILYALLREHRVIRVARGYYSVAPGPPASGPKPSLSHLALQVVKILQQEGINFYVTGLDILAPYFDQVPASYPPLVYIENGSSDWAAGALEHLDSPVMVNPRANEISVARAVRPGTDPVILRPTAEFAFVDGVLATTEKAFIDLYYEITRGYYEFPIGDLAHMLVAYYDRGLMNPVRMVGAARRRRIDAEVRYLLDVCFGMFHGRSRPTLRLSPPVQQFIRTVRKLRNQITHGQNR